MTKVKLEDQSEQERQNQCIAFGDGKDYVKYEKNPVVIGDMLPENCSRIDFRDPKIWKENDTYYLIVGSKDNQQIGQVVLCSSKDLKEWKFETILASNESGKIGTMWECPDFFPLGNKRVLICSPQNMKAEKYEFHNGHNSVYFAGDYDSEAHSFVKEEPHPLDYGMDFYAPQTTELPDGRRIMIAWMKSWDACVIPDSQDWQGMMTLPRELELKDGRIWQKPVREIETYHKNFCKYEKAEIDGETTLAGVEGRTIDFTENGVSSQGNPLFEANPGGAPCNVLAMLSRFGYKTAFIGKVGNDFFGKQLEDAITEVGIDVSGLKKEEKIISFFFLVPSSMLSTVSALGAQNIGAKKPERAQQTLKYAIMIAFGFGLVAETTKKFCLTFLKKTNIITDERVANLRKSSFAARFYFVYAGKSV